jgi:hypothetical protein
MIVQLTERDAGLLPRGQEPDPARRAPVGAAGGAAIGRTLASSRAVAAPTPYRRPGDENDLPLWVGLVDDRHQQMLGPQRIIASPLPGGLLGLREKAAASPPLTAGGSAARS